MRNQIKGLNMASKNAADGISLIQTAEGALQEVHEMLKRMRELVLQGANDTNVSSDRQKIGAELKQLVCEINETAKRTEFNTRKLINGANASGAHTLFLQVGANSGQNLQFNIKAMSFNAIAGAGAADKYTSAGIGATQGLSWEARLGEIDKAISEVSTQRANLGALQNRLEHTIKNLDVASENLSAAESRIRDTDMAKEMMEFTKSNILSQAGMSMLSQANQAPNNVLSIIR